MTLTYLFIIAVGLAIGSFLNVCIYRVPRRDSVITPRSRCLHCGHQLRVWENIPLVSFLILKGRCSQCRGSISWVYPVTEVLTACVLLLLYLKYGLSLTLIVNGVLFCLLVVLIFVDLRERILPDPLTLGGAVVGFLLSPFQSQEFFPPVVWWADMVTSFIGILMGGGILLVVAILYFKLRKIEGLGFGDIKMMGMVGAFLGYKFAWMTIFFGAIAGAVAGTLYILLARKGSRYELPFGTFLGLAGFVVTLWGNDMLTWYLGG